MSSPLQQANLWRAMADGLQQAIWLIETPSLKMLYANQAAAQLVGMAVQEMLDCDVRKLAATPQDQIFWQQPLEDITAGIRSYTTVWNADKACQVAVERWVQALPTSVGPGHAGHQEGSPLLVLSMLDRTENETSTQEFEALLSELRATLDSAADGILTCDLLGRIRAFNHRLAQIWQLPETLLTRRDDEAIEAHMHAQVLDPEGYRLRMAMLRRDPLLEVADIFHLRNGSTIEQRSVPQLTHGRPSGRVYIFRDITQLIQAQAGLKLAAQVFDSSLDAIFIADQGHAIVRINTSCQTLLQGDPAQVLGRPVSALLDFDLPIRALMPEVEMAWEAQGFWAGEAMLRTTQPGVFNPVQLSWVVLRDDRGAIAQSIGFMRDLAPQRAVQQRIEELTLTDTLTGLPNRVQLTRRVQTAIDSASKRNAEFALLFLDLDRFKIVNDSLGHPFGDRVLKLVALRLQDCLRQADMLCRVGGDEFVIYLHDASRATAESVARRVLDEMNSPFTLDGMGFSIQGSIGISLYPHDGHCLDDLIKHADSAMYRVKERGRGSYGFYQPEMNANLLARMKMEHAMRLALGSEHMAVHYQPQVDFATGRIAGMEALLRWQDPQMGAVSPAAFIPLAEECGYIITLGAWVMEQAVREAAYWQGIGLPLVVSVNVSALEFRQPGFVERTSWLLSRYGLPGQLLELELTETVLLQDAQEMEQLLGALAQLGIGLSIDDFGTGYSSLAYLKRLPIDRLKIDKSFVDGLPGQESDEAIVYAIISMGRALGIEVVAEGVETIAQRDVLQAMGCDFYQGYLCARALPSQQLRELVQQTRIAVGQEVSANATGPSS
ncbi:EAL domain-containing protein [Melaminivora sp.]